MEEINLGVLANCLAVVVQSTTLERRKEMKGLAEVIAETKCPSINFYRQLAQFITKAYNDSIKLKCDRALTVYLGRAIAFFQAKEDETRSAYLHEYLRHTKPQHCSTY